MRSGRFVSAFGAELRAGLELRAAFRALVLRPQRLAAFGAELRALCPRAALGTRGHGLARDVEVLGQILLADFLADLLGGCLGLRRGQLGIDVRRVRVAEGALLVPARRLTDPLRAFRTLPEIRLGLLDGA